MYYKHLFRISGKRIEVYPSVKHDSAIVFLNTFAGEGDKVYQALHKCGCRDFTLVAISGLSWDHDMAPWDIPPISKNDTPCTGGADEYLQLLTEEIIPRSEELVQGHVLSHEMKSCPKHMYFSLGDMEYQTKNPYLKTVQENTEKIECFYAQHGIDTTFRLNPGNHYKNAVQRTAAGISWILNK